MKKILTQIFLVILGSMFLLYGTLIPLLWVVGERTTGQVTVVRRELGERDEAIRNRFSYSVGYEFTLPDGTIVYGNTKTIGNSYNAGIALGPAPVRYLKIFPHLNALEEDTRFSIGTALIIAVGILLLVIALRKPKPRAGASRLKKKSP